MSTLSPKIRYLFNLIIIWSLISLTFTILSFANSINERENISFFQILGSNLTRYGLWGLFSHFIFKLTRNFDFQSAPHYWRNIFIQVWLGLIFSTIHFVTYTLISWVIYDAFRQRYPNVLVYLQNGFLGSFYIGLLIYGLIVFASQAFLRNKKYIEEEKKASLFQAQLVESQLQALKMQLQPHFLFNTLNSISSLIIKNPIQAQTMIAKLGDFLRMTLDFNKNQMVFLNEELSFLRSYLEIEQTRFSEKLQVTFNIDEEVLNAVVPHLALQPIVENSIKHGISQMTEGGRIEIMAQKYENELKLTVTDNGPGQSNSPVTNQTGLANIKARLEHLYGVDFSFEMNSEAGQGMIVTLTIPLNFEFAPVKKNDE
jgi:two-component system LytT family sensor kinase